MKKLIALLMIATLAISCGKTDPAKENEKKEQELQKMESEYKELGEKIQKLKDELAGKTTDSSKGTPVMVQEIALTTFKRPIEVQGVVESDQNITINSEVPGAILEIVVKEGQPVSKGQVLVRLNGDVLASNIGELENAYELAQTTYERTEKLYKQGVGTEMGLLQAKNRRDGLQKQLATARTQYSKYTITAPISGVVDEIMVKQGENANPGFPVMRIVDNSKLNVKADISERYVKAVKTGDSVMLKFNDAGLDMVAKISAIGQIINPGNRTFTANISLPPNRAGLKPNLLAMVTFYDYVKPGAIVVPSNLVIQEGNKEYVYTVVDTKGKKIAKKVQVTRGQSGNGYTVIESGLNPGDMLVTENSRNLQDGSEVAIAK